MPKARITVPERVASGAPFEVRIQIRHAMETGYRTDDMGKSIPRNVIRTLTCRYNGDPVFVALARASGELTFDWIDDAGTRDSDRAAVSVA